MANSGSSSSSSSSESSSSSSSSFSSSSSDYSRRGDRRRRQARNRERENERVAEGGRDRIRANPAHPPVAMDQPLPVNVVEQPAAQEHGGQQHEIGGGLDGEQVPIEAQLNRVV
ncbi:ADP-ribosylation factor-like protein 6-interacting protein 4 [Daphnia pulicaria]|uniref:ADP-ribosylation factor-like protein 6-interacting protein 4 n=1 Tax=Daphnia pulicaria TaxID=35523 RepID=UPI001EEB2E78|nr:ADP-ribosylation factor-like protein 6-interacting protein 4 [Daphnia pulicaria]XP_046642645.1 ADP-ribosylation factor-like protein 6-interacting protein 4 [Daphnia pulicaria]